MTIGQTSNSVKNAAGHASSSNVVLAKALLQREGLLICIKSGKQNHFNPYVIQNIPFLEILEK